MKRLLDHKLLTRVKVVERYKENGNGSEGYLVDERG